MASAALSRVAPAIANNLKNAIPAAGNALQRAAPQLFGQGSIPQQAQAMQNATNPVATNKNNTSALSNTMPQQVSNTSQPPIGNQVSPNIAQPQPVAQPQGIVNPREYLEKLGIRDKVDNLLKAGNSPEQAAAALGIKRSGEAKIDPELLANIDAYSKETLKNEAMQPQGALLSDAKILGKDQTEKTDLLDKARKLVQETGNMNPTFIQRKLSLPYAEASKLVDQLKAEGIKEEAKPITKNETVMSPHGVAEVKEIRNGQAIIDVDGKLHKVKEDELEAEPEEVRQAKFDFDPETVPEDLRSAPLNEVYTPANRRHVTVKYNAGLKPIRYMYVRKDGQPISEEYIDKIKKGVQLPVSSGKSFWGTWRADESDSRGAANYEELVSNSQEEGEEDDPSKEYWFIKEEAVYEHPYMEKAGKEQLRAMEKEFNEKNKKPRKKKKA